MPDGETSKITPTQLRGEAIVVKTLRYTPTAALIAWIAAGCSDARQEEVLAPQPSVTPASPAPLHRADPARRVNNSYIVVLADNVSARARSADARAATGGSVGHTYERVFKGFSITVPDSGKAYILRSMPGVRFVEENETSVLAFVEPSPAFTPTVQSSPDWHLDRVDQRTGTDNAYSWSEPTPTLSRIYLVDSGVRTSHNEFSGRVGAGAYFIGSSVQDCNGHGTAVAGAAAGTTYGIAKSAEIIPVRVNDCDNTVNNGDLIDGLEWVLEEDDPYTVVNISTVDPDGSWGIDLAVAALVDANYVVVAAAGNDTASACNASPGRVDEVITVGAIDDDDTGAVFSNYGSCVDVWAPGVSITTASHGGDASSVTVSGTSVAAPIVAGVIYALETEENIAPSNVFKALFGDALAGTAASVTTGELSGLGAGSPNRLIYSPRSYTQIVGSRQVSQAMEYTWLARAWGGDDADFTYNWETSTNGTNWTTVGTGSSYNEEFDVNEIYTLYMRLTVENEFGDETEHEIEIDVDTDCGLPECPT